VLVLSTKFDVATDAVVSELGRLATDTIRLNTEDFPFETELSISIDPLEPDARFLLQGHGDRLPWRPRSVWLRRLRLPVCRESMEQGAYEFAAREARAAVQGGALVSGAPTMNPAADAWAAENKLFQLSVAQQCGLDIPTTLVTNSPDRIRQAYRDFHGQMIVKAVRTGYAELERGPVAVYTRQVLDDHLARIECAKWSPSIYQPLIPKKTDVRVTIVGGEMWAAEIHSQVDPKAVVDWRQTDRPDLPHSRLELSNEVRDQLRALMRRLGLIFGAIDLVRTPDDRYVFLEVNPSGQWLWIEHALGSQISKAIAAWLTNPAQ
jgi:glutathione synthase/RimK-type ligase-like ATP-grasp enzyme